MRMFVRLDDLKRMCESVGFKNVRIVDADSPLEGMEIPEETSEEDEGEGEDPRGGGNDGGGSARFKIHGRYADHFKHLESMDMDELCKVVTVYGEKI